MKTKNFVNVSLTFCSWYRCQIQSPLNLDFQYLQTRSSERWFTLQLMHLASCEHGSPSGVAGIGGLCFGWPQQQVAGARWNSMEWISPQIGHSLPLRGQIRAFDGCPNLQQQLHCGTPICFTAGAMTRRCFPYINARLTRLRMLRPDLESSMSNQRVPVSECGVFLVR